MPVLNGLAAFAVNFAYDDLPTEIVEESKLLLVDTIGVILVGTKTKLAKAIHQIASHPYSLETATILSTGGKTEISKAIHLNCSMAHCAEIDSIHPQSIVCAAGMVVPAAMAIAEAKRLSGKQLVAAIAIGCEVAVRLGKSAKGEQFLVSGWWPSSIFGPLGVCAAICSLEGLTPQSTTHALAIASTICGGLINGEPEGATARHFLYGWSARGGAAAVKAAQSGFTGPERGLAERNGLYLSRAVSPDFDETLEGLGERFHLHEIVYKEFACAMQMQSAIHGFLDLIGREEVEPSQIKEIRIRLPAKAMITVSGEGIPKKPTAAAAHARYLISAALLDRNILPRQFENDKLRNPQLLDWMDRVFVIEDASLEARTGSWPARVEILLNNGSTYLHETQSWIGGGFKERKSFVYGKFQRVLSEMRTGSYINDIVNIVEQLENLEDISELIAKIIKEQ